MCDELATTNQLWVVSAPWASHAYDALGRLVQVNNSSSISNYATDGDNTIAEYDGSNALLRRYAFGNGVDDPIVQYEGSGTTDRRFMSRDERGSVISLTDSSGALIGINRYDEYGRPQSTNIGRFQYTGQMWLSELGAYHYKARVYLPHLGIFAQTDPAGYDPSPNLFAYVGNDPVNANDPTGKTIIVGMRQVLPTLPFFHLETVVIPDDQAYWAFRAPFNLNRAGAWFTTIGARPLGTILWSEYTAQNDVFENVYGLFQIVPPTGYSENDLIRNMLTVSSNYCQCLGYNPFPEAFSELGGYNSNSYIEGLLNTSLDLSVSSIIQDLFGDLGEPGVPIDFYLPGISTPVPSAAFSSGGGLGIGVYSSGSFLEIL